MDIIKELERRSAMTKALVAVIERLFEIDPGSNKKVRRNTVHLKVGEAMGVQTYNSIPARRAIIEILTARGVKLGSTDGKKYFRGLGERCNNMTTK